MRSATIDDVVWLYGFFIRRKYYLYLTITNIKIHHLIVSTLHLFYTFM